MSSRWARAVANARRHLAVAIELVPRPSWRTVVMLVVCAAITAAGAIWLPIPAPAAMRDWAQSFGATGGLLFILVHAVVTVTPIPRTFFTLAAGLLYGPLWGIVVAVAASTISAILAFLFARRIAGERVQARIKHPLAKHVQRQLSERGWLAVGSIRLIAPVPFAVLNYLCGVSTVRLLPYTLASFVGLLPGTAAIVLLGDAATHFDPTFLLVSACNITIGVAGLVANARLGQRAAKEEV